MKSWANWRLSSSDVAGVDLLAFGQEPLVFAQHLHALAGKGERLPGPGWP